MKLTYFQLETHLTKSLSSVYIISGDEPFLKNEAIKLIRKSAKTAGFTERLRFSPDDIDADQLYSNLYATSLLAEKRLLEFDFRDALPNKAVSAIFKEYASNPVKDNLLLIDVSKVDDKISRSAWYQALEKMGIAVTIWPITRDQLPNWIVTRAKKYKLTIDGNAANLLSDYVEGNLIAAAQAIEKIYLLNPEKPVDSTLIHQVMSDESQFTLFDFVDQLLIGDKKRALHVLQTLKADGTEAILILWAIVRELRTLAEIARQLGQGQSHEQAFQQHRVFAKRQPAVRRFLNHVSSETCESYLYHAAQIDKMIKGVTAGDAFEALQLFCLRLI